MQHSSCLSIHDIPRVRQSNAKVYTLRNKRIRQEEVVYLTIQRHRVAQSEAGGEPGKFSEILTVSSC